MNLRYVSSKAKGAVQMISQFYKMYTKLIANTVEVFTMVVRAAVAAAD